MSAHADVIFNFNSLASGAPSSGGVGPNGSIQNYMNNILGCNCVTVTGGVADKTYNGEGYAVGPNNGSTSLTLGNTDGATSSNSNSTLNSTLDTFIATTNDSSQKISDQITMKFSGYVVSGTVSFDYEIFPDGSSNQPPDFQFVAKNGNAVVSSWTVYGVSPGTAPIGSVHSPNHQGTGNSNKETSQQLIGHWSGTLNNVTELDFIDWPPTIGIDNLTISKVPEPASILLLGTGLAGLFRLMKKRQKA